MDYKDTLNLPETDFSMKANLAENEPKRINIWQEEDLYFKMLAIRNPSKKYVLHDGPPYANGNIHLGHALNKILKDIIIKIKHLEGYYAPYVPGWDCHGLPIEHQVDKKLGEKKRMLTKEEIRKLCRAYAEKYINIQRNEFIRLGVIGDWNNPYVTMDFAFEATILEELYKFFDNKGIYKSSKPVYWCSSCITALAEAEVEYANHISPSIFVKFKAHSNVYKILSLEESKNIYLLIWTTTPWTLPANLAIALNGSYEYGLIKINKANNKNITNGDHLIIAIELIKAVFDKIQVTDYEIIKTFKGKLLESCSSEHPFYKRASKIILADHVTLEQGTGLVHTAPGHGLEDYVVGIKYGLEVYNPVDDRGNFVAELPLFGSQNVFEANKKIINYIDNNGSLLTVESIEHQYPHCWRCKNPVIYRATPQWFISMETNDLRKKTLEAIKKVRWIPSWGETRITSMIENRPDWCISRQRSWGVPIAVLICSNCGNYYLDDKFKNMVLELFRKEGADSWFKYPVEHFLNNSIECKHCGKNSFRKETDILDVWFDSGSSHAAVCEKREELGSPANMYLEGSDQHRGWFHSSILESVGTRGVAPYREVLTHGFFVDGTGKKMSKSLGNAITPFDIINKYGAEILRLWVSAEDYTEDIRISDDIIKRLVESYRKVRNTARFILGNINDFSFDEDIIIFDKLMELDRFILIKWQEVKSKIYNAYSNYQFHIFYHTFLNFCVNELSAFYLDIIKDRLYTFKKNDFKRKSAQNALFTLIREMAIIIAPILSFTAEEIWEYLPSFKGKKESVFFETFQPLRAYKDKNLESKFDFILNIKKEVNKKLEEARAAKIIGHSLDAKVTVGLKDNYKNITNIDEGIEKIFIVSEFTVTDYDNLDGIYSVDNFKIKVEQSKYPKCERCWVHSKDIGKNFEYPNLCNRCVTALK